MRSVVLCEGADDAYILGYFLHKTSESILWERENSNKAFFSKNYSLPDSKNIDIYSRSTDKLAIWCVGGKDNFKTPLAQLKVISEMGFEDGIDNIFLLTDRDHDEVDECLKTFERVFFEIGWEINLKNNEKTELSYNFEDDLFLLNIIPVIIPFDEEGALETILINAIAGSGLEEAYITMQAKSYVDEIVRSGNLENFLQHEREILKAKFSSVISITNPERSTATFNKLLMAHDWEKKEEIIKHFHIFNDILN